MYEFVNELDIFWVFWNVRFSMNFFISMGKNLEMGLWGYESIVAGRSGWVEKFSETCFWGFIDIVLVLVFAQVGLSRKSWQ